jgi:uncharacterized protein (TIGR02444 family)
MRDAARAAPSGGEALWRFSLALYARPGVAGALLALQDRAGIDVDLVLFALWFGATRGRRLDAAALGAAETAMAPRGLVQTLRGLRRELKTIGDRDAEALRRRVLALELSAERRVQHRLLAAFADRSARRPQLAAAEANLGLILGDAARSAEADLLRRAVASLMRAAG